MFPHWVSTKESFKNKWVAKPELYGLQIGADTKLNDEESYIHAELLTHYNYLGLYEKKEEKKEEAKEGEKVGEKES